MRFRYCKFSIFLATILSILNLTSGVMALTDNHPTVAPFKSAKPRVLVLHSYHSGFTWTDNIAKGLQSSFADFADRIDLNVEYMDTRRIYTGQYFAELKDIYRLKYGERLRFTYLEDLTIEELQQKVAVLSNRTIIFMFIFSRDKAGRVFSHEYNLKSLYQYARVPIYGVWKFYLGHGIVGGRYIEANRAFFEMTGYSRQEVLGRCTSDFSLWINYEDRSRIVQLLKQHGKLNSYPIQFRMKNGKIRDFLWSAAVLDLAGEPCSLSGLVDITERKQAEEALVRSEKRFRDLAELLPETIFEIDIAGKLTFANRQAFDQFLYSRQDFEQGLNGFDLLAPEDRQRAAADSVKILDGKILGLLEYTALRKDGSTFPVLVHSTAIYHRDGAVGLRGFMIDVSEKKRLEAQLQQAQKLKSLGTLAGGIAHDFNNLLMGIQGRTSLMTINTPSFHPHYEHLREIENYVISAAELTKQLLGFARGGKYEVKPTDLNQLIAQNSRMFGRTKKEITIHRIYQENLWTVEVDQGQIDQVLLNIYVNAWQAMPHGGDLYIQTENVNLDANFVSPHDVKPGRYVMISVTDSGIGMDESTLKRVFDPFFSTKTKERGTGLGLASAYGIIQNHDGIITAHSVEGQGASFKIYLPSSSKAVPAGRSLIQELSGGTETILLVDDEEMILSAGRGLLEKIGYSVLTAESGQKAVTVYDADQTEIDLVVLDMVMPDMSGGDTYNRLKKINPAVKVLLSSGYSINGQATEILERGCNGFIQKPFTMKAFSQKVREILDH
ncbi:PAS/PAC sensor hybrid histidine kinase [Olavius sp. associated proteobacterium Delta 1]|nr:PAS/PAC sensor hybrid histidine kinase [Olavius sp. associated proteobacterium Delta 1]